MSRLQTARTQSMAQDLLNRLTYFVCCKKKFILLESHIFYNCTAFKGWEVESTLKQDVDFYNCVDARTSTGALCN